MCVTWPFSCFSHVFLIFFNVFFFLMFFSFTSVHFMKCLTAGRLERSHVVWRLAEVLKEKVMLFAPRPMLASSWINLCSMVCHHSVICFQNPKIVCIVPVHCVHCVLFGGCSDSVRWIKLERLCTAVGFLDLECANCQPFPRPQHPHHTHDSKLLA